MRILLTGCLVASWVVAMAGCSRHEDAPSETAAAETPQESAAAPELFADPVAVDPVEVDPVEAPAAPALARSGRIVAAKGAALSRSWSGTDRPLAGHLGFR